jgi:hypothetical protein
MGGHEVLKSILLMFVVPEPISKFAGVGSNVSARNLISASRVASKCRHCATYRGPRKNEYKL